MLHYDTGMSNKSKSNELPRSMQLSVKAVVLKPVLLQEASEVKK